MITQKVAKLIEKANRKAIVNPMHCAASCVKCPEYTRPPWGSPKALYCASLGAVKNPHETVPQMPARPCADRAPTGSSISLSIAYTPSTTITPATAPMIGAAQIST